MGHVHWKSILYRKGIEYVVQEEIVLGSFVSGLCRDKSLVGIASYMKFVFGVMEIYSMNGSIFMPSKSELTFSARFSITLSLSNLARKGRS